MDISQSTQIPAREVVTVCGDIDLAVLTSLPSWFQGFLGSSGRHIGLDLAQVTFLDCAGFRALLAIEDHAGRSGGSVRLAAASPAVARLLELLELPAGSSFLAAPFTLTAPAGRPAYSGALPHLARRDPLPA